MTKKKVQVTHLFTVKVHKYSGKHKCEKVNLADLIASIIQLKYRAAEQRRVRVQNQTRKIQQQ